MGATIEDGPVPSQRTRVLSERASSRAKERGLRPDENASLGPGRLLGAEATVVAIGPEGGFAPANSHYSKKIFLFSLPRAPRPPLETAVVVALARLVDPG